MPIDSATSKYLFCLAVLVVMALLAKNLVRGAIGREWMAIRDMDVAATVIGIRPMYAKLIGLCRQLLHRRHGRRAVGLCSPGCLGAALPSRWTSRSSCCSW